MRALSTTASGASGATVTGRTPLGRTRHEHRLTLAGISLLVLWLSSDTWATIIRVPIPVRSTLSLAIIGCIALLLLNCNTPIPSATLIGMGMVLCLLIPTFGAPATEYADQKVSNLILRTGFLIVAPTLLLRSRDHLRFLLQGLAITTGLIALYSFFDSVEARDFNEIRLTFGGRNPIALGRLFALGGLASLLTYRRGRFGGMLLFLGVANLIAMVRTASRGPFWALCIALAIFLWINLLSGLVSTRLGTRIVRTVSVIAVLSVAWVVTGIGETVQFDRARGFSSAGREFILAEAFDNASLSAFGTGWGSFADLGIGSSAGLVLYPHNLIVELAIEGGLLLLLALLVASLIAVRRIIARGALELLPILSLLAMNSLVSGDINDNALLLAFLCWSFAVTTHRPTTEPATPILEIQLPSRIHS